MEKRLIILFLCSIPFLTFSQGYDLAMGLRLGTDWGLTVKQRVAYNTTLEAILQNSFRNDEAMVTVLATQHMPFITKRFNLYTGGGFHKGWSQNTEDENYKAPLGVSIIGGLELSLGKVNLSYDIKPALNIIGGNRFLYVQSGLSVRYVLMERNFLLDDKKRKKRKKKRRKKDEDWKFWKDW